MLVKIAFFAYSGAYIRQEIIMQSQAKPTKFSRFVLGLFVLALGGSAFMLSGSVWQSFKPSACPAVSRSR